MAACFLNVTLVAAAVLGVLFRRRRNVGQKRRDEHVARDEDQVRNVRHDRPVALVDEVRDGPAEERGEDGDGAHVEEDDGPVGVGADGAGDDAAHGVERRHAAADDAAEGGSKVDPADIKDVRLHAYSLSALSQPPSRRHCRRKQHQRQ